MYATLNDSYQWNQLNHNGALNQTIQNVLKDGIYVTLDQIPTAVLQLRNKIKSPITQQLLNAIKEERIVLVYSPNIKIPVYLPFVVTQPRPNTLKGIVFLNIADADYPENGNEIFLNARKFKVSLESCYFAMCIRELKDSPKLKSTTLLRSGSKIYATMVTECINRKHSIKLEENIYNSLLFLTSRYYIGTMLGFRTNMDKESMRNYCLYNCRNADVLAMDKIINQFEEPDFDNISTFLTKVKEIPEFARRLHNLTVSNFTESFINIYNASALLGIETFPYFLYNIISVVDSTYINNYPVLKNIVGDDGKKLYADLIVMTSNL